MGGKNDIRKTGAVTETRSPERAVTPWDEMERWLSGFGRHGPFHPLNWEWPRFPEGLAPFENRTPRVDVLDRDGERVVKAELPGIEKDDIEVTVTDHSVSIRAETRHEEKKEEGEYFRREMSYGTYQRTLELPATVDEASNDTVRFNVGRQRLDMAVGETVAWRLTTGSPVTLGMRPRSISLTSEAAVDTLSATIDLTEPMGAETLLHLDDDGRDVRVVVDRRTRVDDASVSVGQQRDMG